MFNNINIIPIIIAAVVYMILGSIWYSRYVFGTYWMKLTGWLPESSEDKVARKKIANRAMILNGVVALVLAFVIERVIYYSVPVVTLTNTLLVSGLLWLGFTAATNTAEYIYSTKPKKWLVFLINQGFLLLAILAMTFVLLFLRI